MSRPSDHPVIPRPLAPAWAIAWFAIPAALMALNYWLLIPALDRLGVPLFWNFVVAYAGFPMVSLVVASIVVCKREGTPLSIGPLCERLRIRPLSWIDGLWAVGLALFMIATAGSLLRVTNWIRSDVVGPPAFWLEAEPAPSDTDGFKLPSEFLGVELAGAYWVIPVLLVSLLIATLGEELWWRGVILPRQERASGRRAWISHGVLWAAFHLFTPWTFLGILPGCMAMAWVAQRRQSTTVAILAHALANGVLVLVAVFLAVIGVEQ